MCKKSVFGGIYLQNSVNCIFLKADFIENKYKIFHVNFTLKWYEMK